jgi:hypothetical protein
MRVHTFTEAGGHPHNEDALRVEPHPLDPSVLLIALADGQGGRAGGARAAQLAVDRAVELAGRQKASMLGWFVWQDILRRTDAAVAADPAAGFTTLVAFALFADGLIEGASCGDSALLVTDPDEERVWTRNQEKNPPVGSGDAPFTPFGGSPVAPWQLVAMTDGVWKYAGWPAITKAARDLRGEELIAALAARARLPGSGAFPDDFTAAVISSGE